MDLWLGDEELRPPLRLLALAAGSEAGSGHSLGNRGVSCFGPSTRVLKYMQELLLRVSCILGGVEGTVSTGAAREARLTGLKDGYEKCPYRNLPPHGVSCGAPVTSLASWRERFGRRAIDLTRRRRGTGMVVVDQ